MQDRLAADAGAGADADAATGEFLDALETRRPAAREAAQMVALAAQVAHARLNAPAMAQRLAAVDPLQVASREALATLPVLRKSDLLALQQAARAARLGQDGRTAAPMRSTDVFGGFATIGWGDLVRGPVPDPAHTALRVFQSPGPLYEPEGRRRDAWRMARAIHAAGFRRGDLIHNSFSYHLTPAGSMMETGAHALGCTVFPGGVGNTELQLQAMAELQPQGYIGTPSFLKILLERPQRPAWPCPRCAAPWSAARPARPRCAPGSPNAGSRSTSATPRPTWA